MSRIGPLVCPIRSRRRHGRTEYPVRYRGIVYRNLLYNSLYSEFSPITYRMRQIADVRRGLIALGRRLHGARLERNDSMAVFAQRIGVSERTVRAMERGEPTVQIGTWLEALWVLDELEGVERLLEERASLLDRVRREGGARPRQRASRRKT